MSSAPTLESAADTLGEIRTTLAILKAGGIANPVPALELAVKELETWERRWAELKWCHQGCGVPQPAIPSNPLFGFGDNSPFL